MEKKTKEELKKECEKLRKLDRWYGILLVSGMVIVVFGMLVLDSLIVSLLGVIPALIAVVFLAPKFHCPYCGAYIKMKFGLPSHCIRCGKPFSGPEAEEQTEK